MIEATLLALSLAQAAPARPAAEGKSLLEQLNRELVSVTRAATPAVVNIASTKVIRTAEGGAWSPFMDDPFFRQFFGDAFPQVPRERKEQSLGTGFLVDPGGVVVTNYHVIEKASEVKAQLTDGREFRAELVGSDPQTDVAVLRIKGTGLPFIPWGNSDALQQGEMVLAVGNPFGLGHTVTSGIVSAVGRSGVVGNKFENFIQTDASINPGNSGGPLINLKGEVVGINSAIRSNTGSFAGISFAIPANLARRVVESVLKTGQVVRGWLGAEGQNLTPTLARQFGLSAARGVLITGVTPGSPAARAGLARGDVILSASGSLLHDTAQLDAVIAQTAPGAALKLGVWRDGAEQAISVDVVETPEVKAGQGGYNNVLDGLRVQNMSPALARRFRLSPDLPGVVVTRVLPGSAAETTGFRPGDVIQGMNRREVRALEDFDALARRIGRKDPVLIYVVRGNEAYFVTMEPE